MDNPKQNAFSHFIAGKGGKYPEGYTKITEDGDAKTGGLDSGMDFGIHVHGPDTPVSETHPKESVWVLNRGDVRVNAGGKQADLQRRSLFDEAPTAVHVGPDTGLSIEVLSGEAEWAAARAYNDQRIEPSIYTPDILKPEYRGAGLVQDACRRNVRLIFDYSVNPQSNLVIGEVVNYPGRWSSYPPHHHDQPEIYHYRFSKPQGYGHAELGDTVFKVRQNDTIVIPPHLDHAQVAAPGYGMWYLWVIRHLDNNPYTGFAFTPDHTWTLDPSDQGWEPREKS